MKNSQKQDIKVQKSTVSWHQPSHIYIHAADPGAS